MIHSCSNPAISLHVSALSDNDQQRGVPQSSDGTIGHPEIKRGLSCPLSDCRSKETHKLSSRRKRTDEYETIFLLLH